MTIIEKILGWFLQEHIREDFNMTAGKRFMVNADFRNKFLINIVKITRNFIIWSHLITILELITLIFTIFFLLYLTGIHVCSRYGKEYNYTRKDFLLFLFVSLLIYQLGQIYCIFDFYFIGQPLCICFSTFCIVIFVLLNIYLLYIYVYFFKSKHYNNFKKKFYIMKFFFYLIFSFMILYILYKIIIYENKSNNNFCQELLIKTFFIYIWYYYN